MEPTPERQRPPRPKRQPQVLRASIEIGAVRRHPDRRARRSSASCSTLRRARASRRQDTVVVTQSQDFTTLDPALAQTPDAWELEYATCAKLLNYPPQVGYRGTRLVPEVATALPTVSPDRLTYTFHVRPGWQFSDGTPVTAASFARAFERARSPELVSPADTYLREVRSWQASGQTLTIHLQHARARTSSQRLALPYFCAVPSTAPNEQRDNLPSAGPFAIASYTPAVRCCCAGTRTTTGRARRYVRQIVYRFGAFPSQIRLQLERGEADYGVVTPTSFAELAQKFKGDKTHLFVVQQPIVAFLALNTQRPLFKDNPWLRQAVNYALDRPTLAGLFGLDGAKPNDEYLPPGFPGYEAKHVYPIDGPTSRRRSGWRRATSEAATRRSSRAARSRASTARWSWRRRSARSASTST